MELNKAVEPIIKVLPIKSVPEVILVVVIKLQYIYNIYIYL